MKGLDRAFTALALALALVGLLPAATGTSAPPPIKVHFNQELIDGVYTDFNVADPEAVFKLVFSQLPDTARVYPTENYYYWSFAANGQTIAGNLRFDVKDRDQGILHVGYFRFDDSGRFQDRTGYHQAMSKQDGVAVEKRGPFEYAVTYQGRSVRFLLNDPGMKPPRPASLRESEVFVGPVFDESGLAFFLMYDRNEKHFFYLLNEERRVAEEFHQVNEAVAVGRRTGFAFYLDGERQRKLLIGVHRNNANRNSYYDGPFDQLPDNYVEETNIQHFIEEAYPEAKGLVDRYGTYLTQQGARLVIMPYLQYADDKELEVVLDCRKSAAKGTFLRCITPDLQQASSVASCLGGGCVGPQVLGEATLKIEIPAAAAPAVKEP